MSKMLHAVLLLGLLASQFNAPLVSHAQEPVGSETPTATVSTDTPTPEQATQPSPTEAATAEPQATETVAPPTATPTVEPIGTASSGTSTPMDTTTVPAATLSMTPTPQFVTPGGKASLHWTVDGIDLAVHELRLEMVLPEGIEPIEGEGVFDQASRALSIEVTAATGQFRLSVAGVSSTASFDVLLVEAGQTLTSVEVTILTREEFVIGTSGGVVSGLGGKVKVTVPDGALMEDATISIAEADAMEAPDGSPSGHAFSLSAHSQASGAELHEFAAEIEIEAHYADFGIEPGHEEEIYVSWYDPETRAWVALPSAVNSEAGTVVGYTNHFSTFDINIVDWEAHLMPSVDAFQVASFTGAGTYALPIDVPAGPGGLKPDLTLSYNSQIVDQSFTDTQPGWVGMGWSLDPGSIVVDDHGDDITSNDSWLLNAAGVSTRIIKVNGEYRMQDEQFWKISYDANALVWTLRDKTGSKYYFEDVSRRVIKGDCPGVNTTRRPYQWNLTRVVNIFGQELTYAYTHETKQVPHQMWNNYRGRCVAASTTADTAVYPSTITYPGARLRVSFALGPRYDYPSEWVTDGANHQFQRQRLSHIDVEQDVDGNGAFSLMKRYELAYLPDSDPGIVFPGHAFTAGGKASMLGSMQLVGVDGQTALPATTFTYDGLHMVGADNGYGGTAEFAYTPYMAPDAPPDFKKDDNCYTQFIAYGHWTNYDTGVSLAKECSKGLTNRRITNLNYDKDLVRPGSIYGLFATTSPSTIPAGAHVRVGIRYGENLDQVYWACPAGSNCLTLQYQLPLTATRAEPVVEGTGSGVSLATFHYVLFPEFHRVASKTMRAGTESYPFTYDYAGPAMNDASNSLNCGSNCDRYFELYSEFRGHAQVTEEGPDGRKTVRTFNQGDTTRGEVLRGKPLSVTIEDSNGTPLSKTLYDYDATRFTADTMNSPGGFDDVSRYWVRMVSEEQRVYADSGTLYSATLSEFAYSATYGNLTAQTDSVCSPGCSEGSAVWSLYRSTSTDYYPNASAYLVGFPARKSMMDSVGVLAARTLFLYDSAGTYTSPPTAGVPTAVRTLVAGTSYSQASYAYDNWGNRTSVTSYDAYGSESSSPTSGARTAYTCFGGGGSVGGEPCTDDGFHFYPLWTMNALGQITRVEYDYTKGVPWKEWDLNEVQTTADYDPFGRITSVTRPGDSTPTLTISYTDNPFTTTITQQVNENKTYSITRTYDGMGRKKQSNSGGVIVDYIYDAYGRVVSQSVPHTGSEAPYPTLTTYDVLGRPLTVTAPDGSITAYEYNELTTAVTNANLNTTTTLRDVWGNVVQVSPPASTGPHVEYAYDVLGRLLTASRGGAVSTMQYDLAGRKTSMSDPDMGYWQYGYDALGNLLSQTDARNCTLTMTYDDLSRLHTKISSGAGCGPQVSTTLYYDEGGAAAYAVGRRTRMTSGTISNSWTYDARGRVLSTTLNDNGTPYATGFTYNSADLPVTMTYPGGETLTYEYNDRMLLESLGNGTTSYSSGVQYDSAGRLTSRTLGTGLLQNWTYYGWIEQGGRLQSILAGVMGDLDSLQSLDYGYDAAGNVDWIKDWKAGAPQLQDYSYDALDRLISASVTGGSDGLYSESYTYDGATGNLASKAGSTYSYNDPAHKHAVTNAGLNSYVYDANGNMTSRTVGGQTFTLGYDAENRVVSVSGQSMTASFVYDGDGNRVKSTINGTTTMFVGNYYEVTGSTVTKYYYAGSQRVAMRQGENVYYLVSDQLGSTSVVVDDTQQHNLISELRYKAWGEVRYTSGTTPTKYTYTGQYSNVTNFGLMYYNARWYDPTLGRFSQADSIVPAGVQGWDRYAYAQNGPVVYSDPSGHYVCEGTDPCTPSESGSGGGAQGGSPDAAAATLRTYALAGISTQSPPLDIPRPWWWRLLAGPYSGVGPAKVTDAQMEGTYGEKLLDPWGQSRGVGLGLRVPGACDSAGHCSPDQADPAAALLAMETRIALRTTVCEKHGCTATDVFIVAALAENESISVDEVRMALRQYRSAGGATVIDWAQYLQDADPENYAYNHGIIAAFTNHVLDLQEQGFYVPAELDRDYLSYIISPAFP